jgi:hypothetical protein
MTGAEPVSTGVWANNGGLYRNAGPAAGRSPTYSGNETGAASYGESATDLEGELKAETVAYRNGGVAASAW